MKPIGSHLFILTSIFVIGSGCTSTITFTASNTDEQDYLVQIQLIEDPTSQNVLETIDVGPANDTNRSIVVRNGRTVVFRCLLGGAISNRGTSISVRSDMSDTDRDVSFDCKPASSVLLSDEDAVEKMKNQLTDSGAPFGQFGGESLGNSLNATFGSIIILKSESENSFRELNVFGPSVLGSQKERSDIEYPRNNFSDKIVTTKSGILQLAASFPALGSLNTRVSSESAYKLHYELDRIGWVRYAQSADFSLAEAIKANLNETERSEVCATISRPGIEAYFINKMFIVGQASTVLETSTSVQISGEVDTPIMTGNAAWTFNNSTSSSDMIIDHVVNIAGYPIPRGYFCSSSELDNNDGQRLKLNIAISTFNSLISDNETLIANKAAGKVETVGRLAELEEALASLEERLSEIRTNLDGSQVVESESDLEVAGTEASLKKEEEEIVVLIAISTAQISQFNSQLEKLDREIAFLTDQNTAFDQSLSDLRNELEGIPKALFGSPAFFSDDFVSSSLAGLNIIEPEETPSP